MDGESPQDRLRLGSAFATMPTKRSASSASLDRGMSKRTLSTSSDTFLHPITRTPSAQFPMTRTPSRQGLAMIKTTEPSPPPTDLTFEDALQLLHKLEKRLRLEVESDLRDLRLQMTAKKIEFVSRKAQRLYTIRQQLGSCRYLCKQEEEVLREFDKVKGLLDQQNVIDEDSYQRTKVECLVLGGKLTDIRRRQRRLSGQVEELESAIKEIMEKTQDDYLDDEEFDLEAFKRKPLEDEPRLATTMSSYPLFNNAPFGQGPPIKITTSYSSDSLAFGATSDDGASEIPDNPSPIPPSLLGDKDPDFRGYYRGRDTTDVSQDEREEAYYPQSTGARRKKKKRSDFAPRNRTSSMSSDTDAEDGWSQIDVPMSGRMSADEAKKIAEYKQKQIEEEKKREEAEQQQIRDEIETKRKEEEAKQEEKRILEEKRLAEMEEAKQKEIEKKRQEELEEKRKAAEEKRKLFEEKKKAELEAKKKEEEEKKRLETEKKKAEVEAKRKAAEERKKALEEKKRVEEENRRAEEEQLRQVEQKRIEEARILKEEAERVALEKQLAKEEEERQKKEIENEQKREFEEQVQFEEDFNQKDVADNLPKPIKKSRSASRDRQAAAKALAVQTTEPNDDDMIFDEEHQINAKEDLFAMIGDTSLKSGKFRRRGESQGDENDASAQVKGVRSKRNSMSDTTNQNDESSMHPKVKSRASSGERPKGQDLESTKKITKSSVSSRTASTEQLKVPDSIIIVDETMEKYPSTDSLVEKMDVEEQEWGYTNEQFKMETEYDDQREYKDSCNRRNERVANFQQGEDENSFEPHGTDSDRQLAFGKKSRTASRERPISRFVNDKEQDDGKSFPKLGKSRTGSKERPTSGFDSAEHVSRSRKESGERPLSRQEQIEEARKLKSRTTSKERPEHFEIGDEPTTSRKVSSDRPLSRLEQGEETRKLKSRTTSQERPENIEYGDEPATSRRVSNDRPLSRQEQSEGARKLKSRTTSQERPRNIEHDDGQSTLRPTSRQEKSGGERNFKSRTSSRERPRNIELEGEVYSVEEENIMTQTSSHERPLSRQEIIKSQMSSHERPLSRQDHSDVSKSVKSRTSSRERPKHYMLEDGTEISFDEEQNSTGMKIGSTQIHASSPDDANTSEDLNYYIDSREHLLQTEQEMETDTGRITSDFSDHFKESSEQEYYSDKDPFAKELDLSSQIKTKSRTHSLERKEPKSLLKSRTTSRERPKSRHDMDVEMDDEMEFSNQGSWEDAENQKENINQMGFEQENIGSGQAKKNQSRTGSRERPSSRLSDQRSGLDQMQESKIKSRTSSRERNNEMRHYSAGDNEDIYAQVRSKRERMVHSRTASGDRPSSAGGSDNQQLGYDDEFDEEDVPGLESAGYEEEEFGDKLKQANKSRTPSFGKSDILGMSKNLLQSQNDEKERKIKSRTTSRERPKSLPVKAIELEMESEATLSYETSKGRSRTSSKERPRSRMSYEDDDVVDDSEQQFQTTGAKSRSASREGRGGYQEVYDNEEFPSSLTSRGAKSRTSSRERPSERSQVLTDEYGNEQTIFSRSRTHSREKRQLENDLGYETMNGRLRRYKDEEALDLAAAESLRERDQSNYNTLDSGIGDYSGDMRAAQISNLHDDFEQGDFDINNQNYNDQYSRNLESNLAINPEYDLNYGGQEYSPYEVDAYGNPISNQDQASYSAVEEDEQQTRARTKKVSFAESDEKFVLRPDPEVKVIPGTKLFCFAPSSTHEQPPEDEEKPVQTLNGNSPPSKNKQQQISTQEVHNKSPPTEEKPVSTSPKAFLKAMLGGSKSNGDSSRDSMERKSLFDSLLRRGRSASLQGSRNSSRHNSLDRGAVSDKGGNRVYSSSISFDTSLQPGKNVTNVPVGIATTDSSLGSVELNLDQDVSDMDSDYSFLKKSGNKKKKPPKVKSVDFDQLFARGHAIGEQREKQSLTTLEPNQGLIPARDFQDFADGNIPFEIYSKDEAFKKAQQGAGISYEEKVQSYLDDQQHQQGMNNQLFGQFTTEPAVVASEGHESRRSDRKLKRERSRSDSNKRMQDLSLERKKEPPKVVGYAKPEDIHIEVSDEPVLQISPPSTLMRPNSRISTNGRQAGSEDFLHNIQEFVRRAEVDQEYTQPVWPAIVQSPNELPPMRTQPRANSTSGQEYIPQYSNEYNQSYTSSYENQNSFSQSLSASRPRSSLGFANEAPLQRPISPYAQSSQLPRRQFNDGRITSNDYNQHDYQNSRPVDPNYNLSMSYSPNQILVADEPDYREQRPPSPYQIQRSGHPIQDRMAPSPGKSYLEMKPSNLPDPFQYQIDSFMAPSNNAAQLNVPNQGQEIRPTPSPRKGRSPRLDPNRIAGDAHLPMMLTPDPLTAHELLPPPIIGSTLHTTQQLKLANGGEDEPNQTIRDTDLYKRLQEGLKNIDKILASESFQDKIHQAGLEYQKYSHHLGRAEFGVLKKRSGSTASVPTAVSTGGGPIQKSASAATLFGPLARGTPLQQGTGSTQNTSIPSRDSSGERPASAMAGSSRYQPITVRGRTSNLSSHQGSRDSSLGRPDSRMSNYSAMPDLEPGFISGSQNIGHGGMVNRGGETRTITIEPHQEIFDKKKEVLHQLALERLAVREAKVWVQVFLLFVLCLCVLVYLQSEG